MTTLSTITVGAITLSLQPYKQMPKADKTPKDYSIKVGDTEVRHPQVMLTGGGAHPAYTYLNLPERGIQWFAGHVASGTAIQVTDPSKPAPVVATPPAAPAPAEQPKQGKRHPNDKK